MKRLGTDRDSAMDQEKIVIGTAIPATGTFADLGEAIKQVISAAFEEANVNGGINNRRLELKFVETAADGATTAANVDRLIKNENVFAMVDLFLAGAENEVIPLLRERGVPLVGPMTLKPKIETPLNRQVFYLLSGVPEQARALISFVSKSGERNTRARTAVIYLPSELNSSILEAVRTECQKEGLSAPKVYEYQSGSFDAAQAVQQLRQSDVSSILFTGSAADFSLFVATADMAGWYPQLLLPMGLSGSDIFKAPSGFDGKLFIAFPTAPEDVTAQGQIQLQALSEKYKLPRKHLAAELAAYAGVKILIEGLRRAGKDPTRETFIKALEGLNQFRTELTPLITYSPTRRIGAMGAYVVSVDLKEKKMTVNRWVDIN
ncbi:MAG TPA: ABC transporter substrate-binding protein [Pyrinomonadaceae bacterium]